jgi:hypothetical protein
MSARKSKLDAWRVVLPLVTRIPAGLRQTLTRLGGSWLWILAFGFWIVGCGTNESSHDDIAPSPPTWVSASPDDVYPQQGIRADTTASDRTYRVRVEWQQSGEPDVIDGGGYIIYRRPEWWDAANRYVVADLRYGVNLVPSSVLSWTDTGDDAQGNHSNLMAPDPDTDSTRGYYWEIRAYDNSGNRSLVSAAVYYRMLTNPTDLQVIRQSANVYMFQWHFTPNQDVPFISYYMLRVYSALYGPDSMMWARKVQRYGSDISFMLNDDGTARHFVRDSTYIWQLNEVSEQESVRHLEARAGAAMYRKFTYQD